MDDPIDYLSIAKSVVRFQHPTLASVNNADGYKPRCRHCFISVDPRSREYRALQLCSQCYDFEPLIIKQKEILHGKVHD